MSHMYKFSDRRNISYLLNGRAIHHRIYSLAFTPEEIMAIAQVNANVMNTPVTVTFRCAFGRWDIGKVFPR